MVVARLIKKNEGKITHHKFITLFLGLLIVLAIGASSTFAWQSMNQGAFNVAHDSADAEEDFDVILLKREIDLEGNRTEIPVSDAGFSLYVFDEDSDEWKQILFNDDEPLFFTDEDGLIVFSLPASSYVIREHSLPDGFGPEIIDDEPITSWYFIIRENEETGYLELVIDGEVVEDGRIIVFNRRLSGDLEVEKEVDNADGSQLTEEQLEQMFEFIVTFSDDEERTFVIYDGEMPYSETLYTLASGESIFLRHGWRAVFRGIPVGVEYRVTEVVPADFSAIGTNAQGEIASDETSYVNFKNTYEGDDEPDPQYGNLLVRKEVRGEGADLDREFRFVVIIGEERHEFTLRHEMYRLFENIPIGTPYTVYEYDYSEEGYLVDIISREGYITSRTIEILFINRFIDPYYPVEGNLEISKTVIGEIVDDIEEEQLFYFTLVLTHLPEEEIEILVNGDGYVIDDGSTVYTFQFQLRHGEVFRIDGLPHETRYDVIEHEVPGFIQEITQEHGMIFEDATTYIAFYNEMIPEEDPDDPVYTSIRICKELENDDINFPSTTFFNFVLNVDGEEYARFELAVGACRVFEDLEVDAEFEVLEVEIPERYILVSSGISAGTLTEEEAVVTFVNRDTLRDIPVEKHWDLGGFSVDVPDYIIIHLMEGETIVEIVRLTPDEDGRWEHIFTVPRYRDGEKIEYSVIEVPVPGWREAVSVLDGSVIITNSAIGSVYVELEVEKQIEGTPTIDKTFEFILSAVGDAPMPENGLTVITGAGVASFDAIRFTVPGTFEYTIHETIPAETGNFTFDTTVYYITIVVEEIDGTLVLNKIIQSADMEVSDIVFVNRYNDRDDPSPQPPQPPQPTQPPQPPQSSHPAQPPHSAQPQPFQPTQSRPPQTGDTTQLAPWVFLSASSGILLVLCTLKYIKYKKQYKA